jgi:hypothetical protein
MNELCKMIKDAEQRRLFWSNAHNNPVALEATDTTKEQASNTANYFEGKYDGLCEALRINMEASNPTEE